MPLKLAVKMAERNKGGATQPAALSGSSRQSGSGAPQPAALRSTLQTLVGHMRVFITDNKKWPKQNKGKSEDERAENKLAKRWSDHKDSIPDDIERELRAISGAPQPADPELAAARNSLPSASGPGAVKASPSSPASFFRGFLPEPDPEPDHVGSKLIPD